MTTRSSALAAAMILAPAALFAVDGPDPDGGADFTRAVSELSRSLGARPLRIPFLGMIGVFTRPMGAEDFRIAIFERGHTGPELAGFGEPMVSVTEKGGDRVRIYAREEGRRMRVLVIAGDPSSTVVTAMRLKPDHLAAFLRGVLGH